MRALRVLLFSAGETSSACTKDLYEIYRASIFSNSSISEFFKFSYAQAGFLIEKSTVGRRYDRNDNLAGNVREIEREKARDQRS